MAGAAGSVVVGRSEPIVSIFPLLKNELVVLERAVSHCRIGTLIRRDAFDAEPVPNVVRANV
jgi:hypothetical protein